MRVCWVEVIYLCCIVVLLIMPDNDVAKCALVYCVAGIVLSTEGVYYMCSFDGGEYVRGVATLLLGFVDVGLMCVDDGVREILSRVVVIKGGYGVFISYMGDGIRGYREVLKGVVGPGVVVRCGCGWEGEWDAVLLEGIESSTIGFGVDDVVPWCIIGEG